MRSFEVLIFVHPLFLLLKHNWFLNYKIVVNAGVNKSYSEFDPEQIKKTVNMLKKLNILTEI